MDFFIPKAYTEIFRAKDFPENYLDFFDFTLAEHPISTAYDLTWMRRDTGERYLVIERSNADLRSAGVIVGAATTTSGARKIAGAALRVARDRHAAARYDVVDRSLVAIKETSAPYGCMTADRAR